MDKFNSPIEGERLEFDDVNVQKGKYVVQQGTIVKCPFDGVVVDASNLTCNGKLKIQHKIGEDIFYSNFCNLDSQIYSDGNDVKKNRKIGETGKDNLEYWITNKSNKKQDIKSFFSGAFFTSMSTDDKKETTKKDDRDAYEIKKEKERNQQRNKEEKNKEKNKDKTKFDSSSSDGKITAQSPNIFLDPFLLPFGAINKVLKEEVDRIKQLMK